MSDRALPPDVARFLRSEMDAIEELDVLLLLWRGRDRAFSADEVAAELRTSPTSVAARLDDLVLRGLAAKTDQGKVKYAAPSPERDALVAAVAEAYASRRYAVIDAIFSQPNEKIRLFAQAFRLRKDEDDDG